MERTEALLIADLREGDTTALSYIVEKYGKAAYRIAVQITKNHEDAHDVMQEAFLKVHESIGTFRQESTFETWLYRIIVNQALNLVKRRDRRRELFLADESEIDFRYNLRGKSDFANTPHEDVEKKELRKWVTQAVDSLPAKHRTVVILHEFEGLTHPQIAAILNCCEGTVRSRLHYARRKLRDLLKPYVDGVDRSREKERD